MSDPNNRPTDEELVDSARAALIALIAALDGADKKERGRVAADIRRIVRRVERLVAPGAAEHLVALAASAWALYPGL